MQICNAGRKDSTLSLLSLSDTLNKFMQFFPNLNIQRGRIKNDTPEIFPHVLKDLIFSYLKLGCDFYNEGTLTKST